MMSIDFENILRHTHACVVLKTSLIYQSYLNRLIRDRVFACQTSTITV